MDMADLASSLAASPRAHLLSAAYTPLTAAHPGAKFSAGSSTAGSAAAMGSSGSCQQQGGPGVRSTSVQDVMRRLLQPKNLMVRPPGRPSALREARYIAAIDILQVHIGCSLHT